MRPKPSHAIVRAYDATAGSLLWEQSTPGAAGFGGQTWTRDITAHGGRVIAAQIPAGLPPLRLRPLSLVRAYDADSGTLLWRDEFDTAGAGVSLNEVDAFGGRVFAVGQGGANCRVEESNCDTVIRSSMLPRHARVGTAARYRRVLTIAPNL